MSNQRLISDARRRAKALSRANASSYQACLDEVARSAGAEDWNSFLADPRPLPAVVKTPAMDESTMSKEASNWEAVTGDGREFVRTDRNRYKDAWNEPIDWKGLSRTMRRESHKAPIITLLTFAAVLLLFRSPVAHYVIEMPQTVGLVILVGPLFVGGVLLGRYLIRSVSGGIILSAVAYERRPRLGIGYWSRLWGDVAIRTALAATLFFGFASGFLDFTFGTSRADAASIADDARATKQVAFAEDMKPLTMGPVSMKGDRSIAEIVIVDQRVTPKALRIRKGFRKFGNEDFVRSTVEHPVLRIKGVVDCRRGTFMKTAMTTADSVAGPAMYTLPGRGRRWVPLSPSSVPLLCGGDGTPGAERS